MSLSNAKFSLWFMLLLLLILCPLMVQAQSSMDKTTSVTGCLQKGVEPAGFFIVDTDSKHWELYPGKGVSLADHLGHTVTVTGSIAHRSAAQELKSQPNEKKEMGSGDHADLQVSTLKMVSETCSK